MVTQHFAGSLPLRSRDRGRLAAFVPGLAMACGAVAAVVYMTVFAIPAAGRVAVVFPPWSARHDNWAAVAAAEGLVIDERLGGAVLVVQPEWAGFTGLVLRSGAWAVVDPLAFGGCGTGAAAPPAGPDEATGSMR